MHHLGWGCGTVGGGIWMRLVSRPPVTAPFMEDKYMYRVFERYKFLPFAIIIQSDQGGGMTLANITLISRSLTKNWHWCKMCLPRPVNPSKIWHLTQRDEFCSQEVIRLTILTKLLKNCMIHKHCTQVFPYCSSLFGACCILLEYVHILASTRDHTFLTDFLWTLFFLTLAGASVHHMYTASSHAWQRQ